MLSAGVDEAGRGPLAGPVVASAVILNLAVAIPNLMDSKKVSEAKRKKLAINIRACALDFAIATASVAEIDEYNILQATLLAMKRAVMALRTPIDQVLIDGQHGPDLPMRTQMIVKGDQTVPAISAASILAKVFRDELMQDLHQQYPEYGFDQHKGYGTQRHLLALSQYGYAPCHRYSFKPVRACAQRASKT